MDRRFARDIYLKNVGSCKPEFLALELSVFSSVYSDNIIIYSGCFVAPSTSKVFKITQDSTMQHYRCDNHRLKSCKTYMYFAKISGLVKQSYGPLSIVFFLHKTNFATGT